MLSSRRSRRSPAAPSEQPLGRRRPPVKAEAAYLSLHAPATDQRAGREHLRRLGSLWGRETGTPAPPARLLLRGHALRLAVGAERRWRAHGGALDGARRLLRGAVLPRP